MPHRIFDRILRLDRSHFEILLFCDGAQYVLRRRRIAEKEIGNRIRKNRHFGIRCAKFSFAENRTDAYARSL